MKSIEIIVTHDVGLHARPASQFVQLAAKFPCDIKICNMSEDGALVNAKSILSVLTLGVNKDHRIKLEADGDQEEEAVQALTELIVNNFGE
ncbi:MAG: HPr family phosphocarrier protein [Anaerolineaceae bacterium]|nr:HPr family phosphocarrier protein [Anaerolineaceae bacterium]